MIFILRNQKQKLIYKHQVLALLSTLMHPCRDGESRWYFDYFLIKEDAIITSNFGNVHLFGVLDGHGG